MTPEELSDEWKRGDGRHIQFRQQGGWLTIWCPTKAEIVSYQRDPDGFAAEHFKLTIAQYREWIDLEGTALCGSLTKAGKPCNRSLGHGMQLAAQEWLHLHRKRFCKQHGGQP